MKRRRAPNDEPEYFAGARMAYEDCAKFAEHMAKSSEGFAEHAVAHGEDRKFCEAVEIAGTAIMEAFAESIREKIVTMNNMISAAKTGPQ